MLDSIDSMDRWLSCTLQFPHDGKRARGGDERSVKVRGED